MQHRPREQHQQIQLRRQNQLRLRHQAIGTDKHTDKHTANTPVSGNLKVEFYNSNPSDTTNSINPQFKVTNTGSSAIDCPNSH